MAGKWNYKNVCHRGESVGQHRVVAEKALGHPLPTKPRAVVHHIDGNARNNRNDNLVICPDQAYHRLIHLRQRALEESGNANYRLCRRCKKWDDLKNGMSVTYGAAFHRKCEATHAKEMRRLGRWK